MTEFGREYGEGLYALCAEEKIEKSVQEEIRCLKNIFRQNPDFVRLLANMSLGKDERVRIVDQSLRGEVHPYVLNFIKLLVERGAIYAFEDCEKAYEESYNREHRVVEAEVTTAKALSDSQRQRLLEKLSGMTGREVLLREKIDPQVVGGVLLQMDGKRYDNTVRQRLSEIKRTMTEE